MLGKSVNVLYQNIRF